MRRARAADRVVVKVRDTPPLVDLAHEAARGGTELRGQVRLARGSSDL